VYIQIEDFAHATALVAEGDITHTWVDDPSSAELLLEAFESRLAALEFAPFTDAVKCESEFLRDQIAALNCDWEDPESPECLAHLY
jgi:hypothetical protein